MKKLIVIGAGGHGKVVADIAAKHGYTDIVFLDDNKNIRNCGRYFVVGDSSIVRNMDGDVIVAIGNPSIRKKVQESIENKRLAVLIHPDAVVAEDVIIGKGTVIMAGTVINPGSVIGRGCIVNTCASVDHDCRLNDYVHVAVGAHVAGRVEIGEETWIGAGVTVSNDIKICNRCMVGAGAVVVKDIEEAGIYTGIPARVMEYNKDMQLNK